MPCIILQAGPEKGKEKKFNQQACVSKYGTFLFRHTIRFPFSTALFLIRVGNYINGPEILKYFISVP